MATNNCTDIQIKQQNEKLSVILNDTISSYYAIDLNDNSERSKKKKQEIAMFLTKLSETRNKDGDPAIMTATTDSIRECALTFANGDFDFFRNQAYLISYGDKIQFMISKDGLVATAKKIIPGLELFSDIVYKNDTFEYEKIGGRTLVTKHIQKIENITSKPEDIVCAYACAWIDGKQSEANIMTMDEIKKALLTAHRSITDFHKNNPKIMFGKFPLRQLAKKIISQNIGSNIAEKIGFDNEEEIIAQATIVEDKKINIEVNEDKTEPVKQIAEQKKEIDYDKEYTVTYQNWIDKYQPSGKYEMVDGSYNEETGRIKIKAIRNVED